MLDVFCTSIEVKVNMFRHLGKEGKIVKNIQYRVLGSLFWILLNSSVVRAAVQLDPSTQSAAVFEGWGTSIVGDRRLVAASSEKVKKLYYDALFAASGLGLNIVRYNIFGGENPDPAHITGSTVPHFSMMPSSFQPERGVWNWNADLEQRTTLKEAQARGANLFEAFSNSPPYWMTKSKCASGAADGWDNLLDSEYETFADYLTEVVQFFRDDPSLKITFRTLDPLNEPSGSWWKMGNSQEGCHFGDSNQRKLIRLVGRSLMEKGIVETTISASDENSVEQAAYQARNYDCGSWDAISQVNFHAYNGSEYGVLDGVVMDHGKRLWMSEYGSTNSLPLPDKIHKTFKETNASAFVVWSPTWGLLRLDRDGISRWRQYYFYKQYTTFIRPGYRFFQTSDPNVLAAVSGTLSQVVLVVKNTGATPAQFEIDLSTLKLASNQVAVYRTSKTDQMAHLPDLPVSPTQALVIDTPEESVTTVLISLRVN